MSHLSASLPVVQYLHYHTKHCPLNPSEASLSLDGVLLSQPTMCFERNASKQRSSLLFYIFYHFLFILLMSFFYLYMYLEYVFRPGEVFFFPFCSALSSMYVAGIQRSKWHKIWHQPIYY